MRRFTFSEAVAAALAAALPGVAPASAQCAMCNTSAAAGHVGRGLSISVLFLLGILAIVVAWLVVEVARSSRRDTPPGGAPPP
jgi:hypothetical protein